MAYQRHLIPPVLLTASAWSVHYNKAQIKTSIEMSIRNTVFFEKDQLTHLGVARFLLTTHKIHSPFLQKGKKGTMRMFSSMRRFTNSNLWILSEIILWRCVHWQELRTWWIKKGYRGLQTTQSVSSAVWKWVAPIKRHGIRRCMRMCHDLEKS